MISGEFFSTGVGSRAFESVWTLLSERDAAFTSRDRAWHTGATMAQFICVSNLTDVLTEASNWMVSANKSNGKKRKENSKDYLFFKD